MANRRIGTTQFTVKLRKGLDGYVIAECPEIDGCMSQGKTKEEALENIRDAIAGCLMVMLDDALARARRKIKTFDDDDDDGQLETLELRGLELVHS